MPPLVLPLPAVAGSLTHQAEDGLAATVLKWPRWSSWSSVG
ncbi:hypothetical protein ACIF9R_37910 [Streptomyces sp. NPDC086080]